MSGVASSDFRDILRRHCTAGAQELCVQKLSGGSSGVCRAWGFPSWRVSVGDRPAMNPLDACGCVVAWHIMAHSSALQGSTPVYAVVD